MVDADSDEFARLAIGEAGRWFESHNTEGIAIGPIIKVWLGAIASQAFQVALEFASRHPGLAEEMLDELPPAVALQGVERCEQLKDYLTEQMGDEPH